MRFVRTGLSLLLFGSAACLLRAQSTVPTLVQAVPAQALSSTGVPTALDLRNHFTVPGVAGTQFAQFDTVLGRFNVELRDDVAPRHVANFLAYVQSNAYANTFIHRSASLEGGPISIIQGGGYGFRLPFAATDVPRLAPVALEYNLANERGTLAAARTSEVNSATSEWYFNVRDNSTILNQTNGGGYTVFGRVLGTGMTIVDAIAALPRYNAGAAFTELPLRNYTAGTPNETNVIIVNAVRRASLFPGGAETSVVGFTLQNSAPGIVNAALANSVLSLTAIAPGTATITVRAADVNGNGVEATFNATVAAVAPVFLAQPASQSVATGSTVVFNAPAASAGTYRWERDGVAVAGATSGTLVINNAGAANAGTYVSIATNSVGSTRSDPANLVLLNLPATEVGRLVNLSILTAAGAGTRVLTMGAYVGPGDAGGALPLLIRAVGPTLVQPPFNVTGALGDPVMTFYAAGNSTALDNNDDWGGNATLAAAFRAVGAFELPGTSLDSAIFRGSPGAAPGGYTVQVAGKGGATGSVLAEMYDAAGAARSATTPRLTNLSTLAEIQAGADLAVGFVLGGRSARTVLIRGVGPSLGVLGVTGTMADPQLELFNNDTRQRITANDDWAGAPELAAAAVAVGAFPLAGASSKDAVLLLTLPPGPYSARLNGVGGTGGAALVEVYEVP